MTSKSERKKQQQRETQRKRLKQRQQKRGVSPSNIDLRQQIDRASPRGWDGEVSEDMAVFDDVALESLPSDMALQANSVRDALRHACESRGETSLKLVSEIPRSSPFSQWRLFLRGFVPWLSNDWEAADAAWKRLDSDRRPGRMAATLSAACRNDAQALGKAGVESLDQMQTKMAKLLRLRRFERPGITAAEVGIRISEPKELLFGPKKIKWLKSFAAEYRSTEPELVAALEQVGLARAFCQNYSDVFEQTVSSLKGPPHDPNNLWLSFFFYAKFAEDDDYSLRKEVASLQNYLKDVGKNQLLPKSLRKAIISEIHLGEALVGVSPQSQTPFDWLAPQEDTRGIEKHFNAAVKAYPANSTAHREYAEWAQSKLENDRLTKVQRKPHEKRLKKVMVGWAAGLPDDAEPRLWLIDYLLENEDTEAVKPYVDWMKASRQEDPRVRSTPWKWQLLEAMRLSRRKAWLDEVPDVLDKTLELWPTWLSKQWFAYLKAACFLRRGEMKEFQQFRTSMSASSGVELGSLADSCMMLGAAQRMRVDAANLKPLRAPVDAAVKNLKSSKTEDLVQAASFFWDLHRTKLAYPALRMHGGKFGKELFYRWKRKPAPSLKSLDDVAVQQAIFYGSSYRFWSSDGYNLQLPEWFKIPSVRQHPTMLAAELNAVLRGNRKWGLPEYRELSETVRTSADALSDEYYRHWFNKLADDFDEALVSVNRSSPFGAFMDIVGGMGSRDDEEKGPCMCEDCRASRGETVDEPSSGDNASWIE